MYADRLRQLAYVRQWRKAHAEQIKENYRNWAAVNRTWTPERASNNRGRIYLLLNYDYLSGMRKPGEEGTHLRIGQNADKTWTVYPEIVSKNPDCFECGKTLPFSRKLQETKYAIIKREKINVPLVHVRFPFHRIRADEWKKWDDKIPQLADGLCPHDTFDDFQRAWNLAHFGRECQCRGSLKRGLTLHNVTYTYGWCFDCVVRSSETEDQIAARLGVL